ncbi:Mu homology domain-containing protein [Scheffersomyces xylosifermentans]|uniref:Mu homology domain-containing protein n=1 Tax=Scheffersomyces xylosifermentans TaxID=1304137 RepID=UPI00315C900D
MITALFIYDAKGDVLMSKLYKDGVKRNISDVFRIQIITTSKTGAGGASGRDVRSPILTLGSTSFVYIRSSLLWICVVARSNQDCSAILEFLYNLESLLKVVLNGGADANASVKKPLTDELVINNFNLIYELLDEVVEFGYPTNLELSYLKNLITTVPTSDNIFKISNSVLKSAKNNSSKGTTNNPNNNMPISDISWRNPGIKYRRNEIFLNVGEKINVLMNAESEVLRSYVDGTIRMKTHLSGMPQCRFGLGNNSILLNSFAERSGLPNSGTVTLEDSKFHQCVELNKFDSERVIQFVPPDGEFQLMSYHCRSNINLPFRVYPQVQEIGRSKLSYKLRIKSCFPPKVPATNVQIRIPTPKGVIKSYSSNSSGKSKFHPEENVIIWKFNKFFGEQEHVLTAEVELAGNSNDDIKDDDTDADKSFTQSNSILNWTRPPITLEFKIEMFACSGLSVKFLKVHEKSNYKTVKWVKYSTHSGSYDIRY